MINIEPSSTKAINRGIEDLKEMATCHAFAQEAVYILLRLAKKWQINVEMEEEAQATIGSDNNPYPAPFFSHHGVRPVTDTTNILAPDAKEHNHHWSFGRTLRQPTVRMGIMDQATPVWSIEEGDVAIMPEMVEDPLLWPFPMRRCPMLPARDKLREAGFELLLQ
jgi:hypothetical protein